MIMKPGGLSVMKADDEEPMRKEVKNNRINQAVPDLFPGYFPIVMAHWNYPNGNVLVGDEMAGRDSAGY